MDDLSGLTVRELEERFLRKERPASNRLLRLLQADPRKGAQRVYKQLKKNGARELLERSRLDRLQKFERALWSRGLRRIAGVDEAGMGPLAGPVVAAAVVFPPGIRIPGINDSKLLDCKHREEITGLIERHAAAVGIGLAEVEEIDRLNIYRAGLLAMRRAVESLPLTPEHVLVDARTIPDLTVPQSAFTKGDRNYFSIAAASIIAKTYRDRRMCELDLLFPGYGFARHKGYGTAEHQEAIQKMGPCPIHRLSFSIVGELCGNFSETFYALKSGLEGTDSFPALEKLEKELEFAKKKLSDCEVRKLKILLFRRRAELSSQVEEAQPRLL